MSIDDVTDITPRIQYVASASQTAFDYPFPIFEEADLKVYKNGTLLTLTTHYTVTGETEEDGGTVTLVTGAASGDIITIYRDIAIERTSDFQQNGPLASSTINDQLDRLTLVSQQLESQLKRAIRVSYIDESTDADLELPDADSRASKYLGFDASGNPELYTSVGSTVLSQSVIGTYLYPRTDAEVAGSVTPTNYAYPPGYLLRYLSSFVDDSTDCTTALQSAINQFTNGGAEIVLPRGTCRITSGFTVTSRLVIRGAGKFLTSIKAVDFGSDVAIFNLNGSSGSPISECKFSGFILQSNNTLARGFTATWVTKSSFEDLYFYELYKGFAGSTAFLNSFKNISVFGVAQETFALGAECNNNHWDKCEFRSTSSHAINVTGNCAALAFTGCNWEGIETVAKAGLRLAPTTGNRVVGVSVIGCYGENIKGHFIETAGADAGSVQGLVVKGNQIYGGYASFFSSTATNAQYAIVLANVDGFDISENAFIDWQTAAFFRSGTELNGRVHNNQNSATYAVPALTNSSNAFSASVDVQNNFAGRKVVHNTGAPASGTYVIGDISWERAPAGGGPIGYVCTVGGTPGTWVGFGTVKLGAAYTVTNPSTDRALNVSGDTTAQVAAVLGTLIEDLKSAGLLS